MKVKYSDIILFRKAEENGLLASTSEFLDNRNQTEKAKELTQHFRENYSTYNELFSGNIDTKKVLYYINWFIDRHEIDKTHVDFPISGGADLHLLPITNNIQLVVFAHYGDGDYTKYIAIRYFVINEHTKKDEVDDLIEFLKELSDF